jgi:hypothetical protein
MHLGEIQKRSETLAIRRLCREPTSTVLLDLIVCRLSESLRRGVLARARIGEWEASTHIPCALIISLVLLPTPSLASLPSLLVAP